LNAERRAIQQRYDDAVARCYRLWEWSVQWLLRSRFQIDTSDLPAEVATRYHIDAGRDGVFQCGLVKGWEILTELTSESDPLKPFLSGHRSRLLDLTRGRNYSILAHGDQPVTAEQWHSIREWTGEQLLPALYPAMQKCGFKLDPARLQLPDSATPLLA
jgi:CRISPR-associated protein (TIGR02710 family)